METCQQTYKVEHGLCLSVFLCKIMYLSTYLSMCVWLYKPFSFSFFSLFLSVWGHESYYLSFFLSFWMVWNVGLVCSLNLVGDNNQQNMRSRPSRSISQLQCHNSFCVTLIDFFPLIKRVSQFVIKGDLFFERERGEREVHFFSLAQVDLFNFWLI